MKKTGIVTRVLSCAGASLLLSLALLLPGAQAAEEEKITLNFVNADIQSVIKTVGQHTGKNFILDPRVTGTVNVVSQTPVSKDLLYPILLSVLRTQGYVNLVLDWLGVLKLFNGGNPFEMLYNNTSVIVGLVYVYMPFMVLPLYATIERLDKSFLEASLDLGASQFTTFLKVTVPLTMPGIVTGIILVFIPCLGSFLTPDLLGGANAVMIGNIIERQFKAANDWPFGAAISFMLMFATFAALMFRAFLAKRSKGVDV